VYYDPLDPCLNKGLSEIHRVTAVLTGYNNDKSKAKDHIHKTSFYSYLTDGPNE
jgi:hypothetical protein